MLLLERGISARGFCRPGVSHEADLGHVACLMDRLAMFVSLTGFEQDRVVRNGACQTVLRRSVKRMFHRKHLREALTPT